MVFFRGIQVIIVAMQIKTFKYRLYPTKAQEQHMAQVLSVCRHWYIMCLEVRKVAWELEQRCVSKSDQEKSGLPPFDPDTNRELR